MTEVSVKATETLILTQTLRLDFQPAGSAVQQIFSAPHSSQSSGWLDGQAGGRPRVRAAEEDFFQVRRSHTGVWTWFRSSERLQQGQYMTKRYHTSYALNLTDFIGFIMSR